MKVCCSSPASICYWGVVTLAAWAVLATVGVLWHPLHATSAATCLLAMAAGCFVNAFKNHTYHCVLTGLFFLIAVFFLFFLAFFHITAGLVGGVFWFEPAVSFLLEWRYSRKLSARACN